MGRNRQRNHEAEESLAHWGLLAKTNAPGGWPKITLLGRLIKFGITGATRQAGTLCDLEWSERAELIERAVMRQDERHRKVLIHHFVYFDPDEAIAKALGGVSPNTIRKMREKGINDVQVYLDACRDIRERQKM